MIDIALAIEFLVPQACYTGSVIANTEQSYNDILWEDDRGKPTWADLEAVWPATRAEWAWRDIRAERDKRLTACDWTQLPDTPLDDETRTAWSAYRQALRDIPQDQADAGGFADIAWPDRPDGI